MRHTKKALSCLIAIVLLMPSANAFAQEAVVGFAVGTTQALPQQGIDSQDGNSQGIDPQDGNSQGIDPQDGNSQGIGTSEAAGSPDASTAPHVVSGNNEHGRGHGRGHDIPDAGKHNALMGTDPGSDSSGSVAETSDGSDDQESGSAPDIQDKAGNPGQSKPSAIPGASDTVESHLRDEAAMTADAAGINDGGQGLAMMPFDQSGAPSTTGAVMRPATTEQFQMRITKVNGTPQSFVIRTDGFLNPNGTNPFYGKHYEWWIDWGDGTPAKVYTDTSNPDGATSPNSSTGWGLEHIYQGSAGDSFIMTIMPAGPTDAWLGSLGGFKDQGTDELSYEILSLLTPLMTRSAFQIANPASTQPSYEWFQTFAYLSTLSTTGPGFDPAWASVTHVGYGFADGLFFRCYNITMDPGFNLPAGITTVGTCFAADMFYDCLSPAFTMNDVFNLPQGITSVGDHFANGMFALCSGDGFTMNDVFNLPQGIASGGDFFAYAIFSNCSGAAFTMNDVFTMPQGITTVGIYFASYMFDWCNGPAFAMNDVFNMPQGITTAGEDFANSMFEGCDGPAFAMNDVFNLPPVLNTIGDHFALWMFGNCSGDSFTMNDVFNLPQGITIAGDWFASSLFANCYGASFTMNDVFNLPQGIVDARNYFAAWMFNNCRGDLFTMNDVFTMPQGITTVEDCFARSMFKDVCGPSFTMNDVFNLPQGITAVEDDFASEMFKGCSGAAFTMNDVFNFPQGITTVEGGFAWRTFFDCSGPAFQVNDVFTFPRLAQTQLDKFGIFSETFSSLGSANPQKRSAVSIINNPNGNPMTAPYYTLYPHDAQYTFEFSAFADLPIIHPNWGGLGQTADCMVSFDANGLTGLAFPGGSAVLCLQGGLVPLPALQLAAGCRLLGWYTDAACTQAWDLANDTVPLGTATLTLYAKGALPLSFVDLGFGVPTSTVGTAIAPISTAPGVSGGQPPYVFSASGLPVGLSIDAATGVISGTPTAEAPAGTASITVTDALGQTATISIAYGEVSKVSGNTGGNGGGGGTGGNTGGNGGGGSGNGGSGAGGNGSGATGSSPNGGAPAGGSGNGGTTQGKGSPQGGGMAKTGDGLGMLATGAAAMALAALIALLVAGAQAAVRRRKPCQTAAGELMHTCTAIGGNTGLLHTKGQE